MSTDLSSSSASSRFVSRASRVPRTGNDGTWRFALAPDASAADVFTMARRIMDAGRQIGLRVPHDQRLIDALVSAGASVRYGPPDRAHVDPNGSKQP